MGTIATRRPSKLVRAESGFVSGVLRERRGVRGVVAAAHVVVAGRVSDRAGHVSQHDGVGAHVHVRAAGNASERAFHAEQAGVPGRDADRSATIAAGGQRDEPARDGRRGAPRRAARGAAVSPRVMGHPVQLRDADGQAPELARRGLAHRHGAALVEEPFDMDRRVGRDPVTEHQRCFGLGPTLHGLELLDAGRDPTERLRDVSVAAVAWARSTSRKPNAFRSLAATAATVASSSSTGERSPDRKASTSEHASPSQGVSAIGADHATRSESSPAPATGHARKRPRPEPHGEDIAGCEHRGSPEGSRWYGRWAIDGSRALNRSAGARHGSMTSDDTADLTRCRRSWNATSICTATWI